ncbi:cytochrome P450 domain protein [Mycobacterium intracellulare 1956]|uniref:Cytochrome P450 domain protein n=1 Tax=Mycobacterium intracellulare 1956 TaxID=1299331 RepID=X8CMX8_MYCIT|nr:cytochrome P450 domain protein [Mycobacterium intracellulare 1956]
MSHGVLPSQIRTRDSGRDSASAMTSGGGANGQRGSLAIG